MSQVLAAIVGNNDKLLPQALSLYLPDGGTVLDMTWGLGKFWTSLRRNDVELIGLDIRTKAHVNGDFRILPFKNSSFDCVVFDPPYTTKRSPTSKNQRHERGNVQDFNRYGIWGSSAPETIDDVMMLYAAGFREAARVLKSRGLFLVKCMDEGKNYILPRLLRPKIFKVVDLFILVQRFEPQRVNGTQRHSRKNYSYLIAYQKPHRG